jgi:hypothetical protein
MANPKHLKILHQGVEAWNKWRENYSTITPNLSEADLNKMRLDEIDFSGTNLSKANLQGSILTNGSLENADLKRSNLLGAILCGTNLRLANLTLASLIETNFNQADLSGADLSYARLYETNFSNANLSGARGLDSCQHLRASTIDHRTIAKSDDLPIAFLRGCGLPDVIINNIAAFKGDPVQFYSCFISYSSKDQSFAERLHADLQNKGVRCWFAPEDLKIGAEIRTGIDESIRLHDKLLLVLSETSVKSQWVQQEVETALAKEREQGRIVLFPIRLDDVVMQIGTGWPAYLKHTRNIGDFTRWKDHDAYRKAFDRLLRDLQAEAKQA